MGKTTIVSSHILTELSTICDTVGIIEAGKLVAAGDIDDILKGLRPAREFTVSLLDAADAPRAEALLRKQVGVKGVAADGPSLRLSIEAGDPEIAALVEILAAERVRIVSFREEMADLETAFMALTRGKLA